MAENSNTFHLVIASVGTTQFDGAALSATLPTAGGLITILPHHEPLVTVLSRGTISIHTALEDKQIPVEDGVIECSGNRVTVLL